MCERVNERESVCMRERNGRKNFAKQRSLFGDKVNHKILPQHRLPSRIPTKNPRPSTYRKVKYADESGTERGS